MHVNGIEYNLPMPEFLTWTKASYVFFAPLR